MAPAGRVEMVVDKVWEGFDGRMMLVQWAGVPGTAPTGCGKHMKRDDKDQGLMTG